MDLHNFLKISKVFHKTEYVMLFAGSHLGFLLWWETDLCNQTLFRTVAQITPCATHYHDISLFFIHDLTYKAMTLTAHICRPRAHPACQTWACVVFHNTSHRMSLGDHFSGFVWGTCLNGFHCKYICHPLFCGGFWWCPTISLLIALNTVLTREEACLDAL